MSYKTILVPLDGSNFAEHALPLAISLAQRSGAALRLVQVHMTRYYPAMFGYMAAPVSANTNQALMTSEQTRLDDLAATIKRCNVPCTTTVLTGLGIMEAIFTVVLQEQIDLIVMTTHGRGPLSRFWLGSVAEEMVRTSPCLVLTMRPPAAGDLDLTAELGFQHVLVPLDGSPQSELVLPAALAMGTLMQAEYHLVHVTPEPGLLDQAQRYLDRVVERLGDLAPHVNTHAVAGPHVATRILELTAELHIDMIAMETHGHSGFERWRLGSTADKIMRGASVPLLTHRTPAAVKTPPLEPSGCEATART